LDSPAVVEPLTGYTIGLTSARRREEFGAALERRGAKVIYGPAIRIIPLADDSEVRQATEQVLAAPLDLAIATTGIGFRGWMEVADTWGLGERLTEHLRRTEILARGPKARGAVRASGLREVWSPESESSSEVLEHVLGGEVAGRRIAVQLHGEPLPELVETLRRAGAEVIEVPVYRWVLPDDVAPLERLVEATARCEVDAVAFTSAPAAASFLNIAEAGGLTAAIVEAFRDHVVAASVGPVTSGPLTRARIPVVEPDRARLGALVREIVAEVPRQCGVIVQAAGHVVEIRGQGVIVDAEFIPLQAAAMAVLRELARRPGHVVDRSSHRGMDATINRLRLAMGDGEILQTVVKRGYRLAVD
jgi:uroporphyrinogen-III synthase